MAAFVVRFRGDLIDEVRKLARQRRFDNLIIEATGISEPLPIAAAFVYRNEYGPSLNDVSYIGNMVTVVDTAQISRNFWSRGFLNSGETVSPHAMADFAAYDFEWKA